MELEIGVLRSSIDFLLRLMERKRAQVRNAFASDAYDYILHLSGFALGHADTIGKVLLHVEAFRYLVGGIGG